MTVLRRPRLSPRLRSHRRRECAWIVEAPATPATATTHGARGRRGLRHDAGPARRVADRAGRAGDRPARPQRRRQDHPAADDLRALRHADRRQRGLFGADVTRCRPHRRFGAGLCHVPEGRGIFRASDRPGEPADAGRKGRARGRHRAGHRGVPHPRRAPRPARGDAQRRRAADAGDGRAYVRRPAARSRRRGLAGPAPIDRRRDLRVPRPAPRRGALRCSSSTSSSRGRCSCPIPRTCCARANSCTPAPRRACSTATCSATTPAARFARPQRRTPLVQSHGHVAAPSAAEQRSRTTQQTKRTGQGASCALPGPMWCLCQPADGQIGFMAFGATVLPSFTPTTKKHGWLRKATGLALLKPSLFAARPCKSLSARP